MNHNDTTDTTAFLRCARCVVVVSFLRNRSRKKRKSRWWTLINADIWT